MLFEHMDFSKIFDYRDELLLDSRNCMKTVAYSVEDIYSKVEESARVMLSDRTIDEWGASELIRMNELYKGIWRNNVRMIFNYAESPVVTRFLNAFNIFSVLTRFSQLVFTEPYVSISQKMKVYREGYESFLAAKQAYIQKGGSLQNFVQSLDRTDMTKEKKDFYKYSLMVTSYLYEEFHVSVHSTIEELVIQDECIRPDIFIWMPAKPQLKLIVECNDFNLHSDKKTFSLDRARDRMLQENGYQILRFSSNEVNENPWDRACELRDFLLTKQSELFTGE
jgi:hypothetical protein